MGLKELFCEAMSELKEEFWEYENKKKVLTPILVISQDPEVDALCKEQDRGNSEILARLEKIKEEWGTHRKVSWENIEKALVAKGLLTQKEIDDNIQLAIRDGVIFKSES